jgi:D-sedoheptulose 7-phosphate isomerase
MDIMNSLKNTRDMIDSLITNKTQNFADATIPGPLDELEMVAQECVEALQRGNKIFFMGNGGSAAEAQHLAGELVSYFMTKSDPYAAIALNTDTSIITAISNDMGYKYIFSRQLQALAKPGDVAIYLSTSGSSENILEAMKYGTVHGIINVSFTGLKTRWMHVWSNYYIAIPSSSTPTIQEGHLILGHILCHYIEEKLENARTKNLS